MYNILLKIGSVLAYLATFLTFQQAPIPTPTPTPVQTEASSVSVPVVVLSTPVATPDIQVLIGQIQELQKAIANYTPEPTPPVVYVPAPPVIPPTVESPTPAPYTGKIEVRTDDTVGGVASNANSPVVRFLLYNEGNVPIKEPVTITTDYPGLPQSFVLNGQGQINWFSLCNMKDVEHNDCQEHDTSRPVGAFNLHFSYPQAGLEKDFQITITP